VIKIKKLSITNFAVLIIVFGVFLTVVSLKSTKRPAPPAPVGSSPVVPMSALSNNAKVEPTPSPQVKKQNVSQQNPAPHSTNTFASSLLKDKNYPQLAYYALQSPNDPQVASSWHHATIQSGRAWDLSTGNTSTVIAVIDTGFALDHEELTSKWAANSGENGITTVGGACWTGVASNKASNNCDDDQNGYIDDTRGWDFVNDDNSPQTGVTNPTGNGTQHGTMVSSLVGARANNSIGGAGIDWQAKIMPLQVLSDNGDGYTNAIAAAIQYATDNGAMIINMSLGGSGYDAAMDAAITYATDRGVLVVAASGNCGASVANDCANMVAPGRMAYPAKYPKVLAVGSTDSSDARSSFSSYGPELDVVAPGDLVGPLASWSSVYTTDGYVSAASGTSFASPIVAGVAGILRAQMGNPTVAQLQRAIIDSVDKVAGMSGAGRTDLYGAGRLNAHKATLLASAYVNPPGSVGTAEIQSRQPATGGLTRSVSGAVATDEWILLVCRVDMTDTCSSTVTNGASTQRLNPNDLSKGAGVYYTLIKGSSLSVGISTISVHSRNYATKVADVTK
jgi:subtilisin family serine protease